MKPKETACQLLAAVYYDKVQDKENAVMHCINVLQSEPGNTVAFDILKKYEGKK
jgi:hypothetical protein